jgi:hypothetical protein
LLLASTALAGEKRAPADVGLVTKMAGKVTYYSTLTQGKGEAAVAFMKVRLKDRFELKPGSELRLLFYTTGRQETWKGPARFDVLEGKTRTLTKSKPKVVNLPTRATRDVRRVPVLLRRIGSGRAGGTLLRGKDQKGQEAIPLSEEEKAELNAARQVYQQMRKTAPKDDLTPELYLLSILDDYELDSEMLEIVKKARAIQPESKALREFEAWLSRPNKK